MIGVVCVHVMVCVHVIYLCVCLLALMASERVLHINMNMCIRGTHICRKQAHTSQWDLVSLLSCLPPLLHPLSSSSSSCSVFLLFFMLGLPPLIHARSSSSSSCSVFLLFFMLCLPPLLHLLSSSSSSSSVFLLFFMLCLPPFQTHILRRLNLGLRCKRQGVPELRVPERASCSRLTSRNMVEYLNYWVFIRFALVQIF